MNATTQRNYFQAVRTQLLSALGVCFACLAQLAPVHAQPQRDILGEIDELEAEVATLSTVAQQLQGTLQAMSSAVGRDGDEQKEERGPGTSSREAYIQQCCRLAYDSLATGVARFDANFRALEQATREYQRRPLIHAFGTASSQKNALLQAMSGLSSAEDALGTLRSIENQLVPSFQGLLPALEALHSEATSQLANAPFYLLSVGLPGGSFPVAMQAAPGNQVVFEVRVDAAMTPEPVLPSAMLTVAASVPHRWENSIAFQPPLVLLPGKHATGAFVADISPGIAATDIPVTLRVTGDFPAGQHRGLSKQVIVRVRNPN